MAGKQNWLEWQGKKISSKETSRGHQVCEVKNNVNKGAWLFFPIATPYVEGGNDRPNLAQP